MISGPAAHILVTVKAKWSFGAAAEPGLSQSGSERLKKLARSLDALAGKDETILQKTREIGSLRQHAALELHRTCRDFVRQLNTLLSKIELEFHPEEYIVENFRDDGINIFQINARGPILQITFEATPELVSTEDFRVPYILVGAIRCFNQQLLEKVLIEEQMLFYTIERRRKLWRFFDARTYRSGPFDAEYLTGLMEQLV